MRLFVIIALAIFWIALAINSYSRGETAMAGVFLLVGAALTVYRLSKS